MRSATAIIKDVGDGALPFGERDAVWEIDRDKGFVAVRYAASLTRWRVVSEGGAGDRA